MKTFAVLILLGQVEDGGEGGEEGEGNKGGGGSSIARFIWLLVVALVQVEDDAFVSDSSLSIDLLSSSVSTFPHDAGLSSDSLMDFTASDGVSSGKFTFSNTGTDLENEKVSKKMKISKNERKCKVDLKCKIRFIKRYKFFIQSFIIFMTRGKIPSEIWKRKEKLIKMYFRKKWSKKISRLRPRLRKLNFYSTLKVFKRNNRVPMTISLYKKVIKLCCGRLKNSKKQFVKNI